MQSENSKIIIAVIITALIVGGGMYFWHTQNSPSSGAINAYQTADGLCQTTAGTPNGDIGANIGSENCVALKNALTQNCVGK